MGNAFAGGQEHSAEYFGDSRNFWWNTDYLELVLNRIGVPGSPKILDVGCGVGHWSRMISKTLKGKGFITGVDQEEKWVNEARAKMGASDWEFKFFKSTAESLPFEENTFDLVTCQTVLIHVADAEVVIREMLRVVKPNGLLFLAEPNNALSPLMADLVAIKASHAETLGVIGFHLACLRGKKLLGKGDETIGEQLPGLLTKLEVANLTVSLNDRVNFITPPYKSISQAALVEEILAWAKRDFWIWNREDTAKYYAAAGGSDFEKCWTLARNVTKRVADLVNQGQYSTAGAGLFYLVSGRKPT
jgi:SAM-dependent methyltransferase